MAISSLTIKKVASYDDNGVELRNLKKLNFFFGYNGSGKSTIARYLHNLSLPLNEQSLNYNSCTQEGYSKEEYSIIVFDEYFKQKNFFEQDSLKGIFSLNQANEHIDKLIKDYNDKIKYIKSLEISREKRYNKIQAKQTEHHKQIIDYCFEQRRQFVALKKATLPYGNSKERHFSEICKYITTSKLPKRIEDIYLEYQRIYDNNIIHIPIDINLDIWNELLQIESDLHTYLNKVIVGNNDVDIAELINNLNISSWVESGREFLDKANGKCPFCQQQINELDLLKEKFSTFFDKQFQENVQKIRTLGNLYYQKSNEIKNSIREIAKIFSSNRDCLSLLEQLVELTEKNIQIIKDKIQVPNEIKDILSISRLTSEIAKLKDDIDKNNSDYHNLTVLKQNWLEDCWIYMASNSKMYIERYNKFCCYYDKLIKINGQSKSKNEGLLSFYYKQIAELRKHTRNTTEAVDQINKILNNVGFNDFYIKEQKKEEGISQYYLKRKNSNHDKVFKSLSEGEKTFISFLYFYQLCIGADNIEQESAKKKIIVIDDPVSSLDSQILFIVATLIHKLAQRKNKANKKVFLNPDIEQIFIFTHNIYFYKEVSFNKKPICTDYFHYKISKEKSVTKIAESYNSTIKDDYSLMWDTLKEIKSKENIDQGINLMLANLMRRIIDTYLEFIGMKSNGSTITWAALDNMDTNSPEYIVEAAFISCINDESHSISPLDDEYYTKVIREEPTILFKAFKNIFKDIGQEHYQMMMDETYEEVN